MRPPLSPDDSVDLLFEEAADILVRLLGYSRDDAEAMASEYYRAFRDEAFCRSLSIPVQDEELFHHEGCFYMALRIHYHLGLKADPHPNRFLDWTLKYERSLKESGRVDQYGRCVWWLTLSDVLRGLEAYSEDATIIAVKPWTPMSGARVCLFDADKPVADMTQNAKTYFLEISVARELRDGWTDSEEAFVERVIRYAEDDA